ncbi:hypothetical protein ACFGVR_00260 [Mucilaginibacter sp. AW1-3]
MEPLQNIKLSFKCPKQLNELQPCNGDWYCDGCKKMVYDFRGMTEEQVMASLIKNNYKMCGIYDAERIEVLPRYGKWFKWASAAMLFLGLTSCHSAVNKPLMGDTVAVSPDNQTTRIDTIPNSVHNLKVVKKH